MSANPVTALKPLGDPVTPVIVKTGGDGGDGDTSGKPNNVTIEASVDFTPTVAGQTWESAQSVKTGRIAGLSIQDGGNNIDHQLTPGDQLASVNIRFGSAQLTAMETGDPGTGDVHLLFTSPEVGFAAASETRLNSHATFPDQIPRILLMVGDQQELAYACKNKSVTLTILFDLQSSGA